MRDHLKRLLIKLEEIEVAVILLRTSMQLVLRNTDMSQAPPLYTTPKSMQVSAWLPIFSGVLTIRYQCISFCEAATVSISELENECDSKNAKKSES